MDNKFLETLIAQVILKGAKVTWFDSVVNVIGLLLVLALPILYIIGQFYGGAK